LKEGFSNFLETNVIDNTSRRVWLWFSSDVRQIFFQIPKLFKALLLEKGEKVKSKKKKNVKNSGYKHLQL
jgi:hypothetical protein